MHSWRPAVFFLARNTVVGFISGDNISAFHRHTEGEMIANGHDDGPFRVLWIYVVNNGSCTCYIARFVQAHVIMSSLVYFLGA